LTLLPHFLCSLYNFSYDLFLVAGPPPPYINFT
jgi:hypothetical protein